MRMILFAALALAAGLPATPAGAQAPAAESPAEGRARISGMVETLAGNTLVIRSAGSRDVTIALPPDTRITALANRQLSDIRPGDFVGSAAIRGRDGKLHAQEVHIFPEALRGTGEGHRAMDKPDQSMTNATVAIVSEVAASRGRVLVLNYQGGTQEIEVGPEVRVVTFVAGDRSLLKPGASVVVSAMKAADGTLTARNVQAEKDGVPPLTF